MLYHILGEGQGKVVNEEVERVQTDAPGLGGLSGDVLPDGIDHYLVLLHVLRAGSVLDVHLSGALVLAVAYELVVDSKLVEQVLEEDHPAAYAEHEGIATVMAGGVNLVGNGSQIIAA